MATEKPEWLCEIKERPLTDNQSTIALKIDKLSKKHIGQKEYTIKDIDLELESNQSVALIGTNGAGKTTLIKCIVGIYTVTDGTVSIYGEDISKHPIKAKKTLAYINDSHDVFSKMTGLEYLEFIADIYGVSKEDRKSRIEEYSEKFALKEHLKKLTTEYSHGMTQKLCILGAILHKPKLWILDEPTVGLDVESTKVLLNTIEEQSKEALVFFSSHDMDIVSKFADKIVVIKDNTIDQVLDNAKREITAEDLEQLLK